MEDCCQVCGFEQARVHYGKRVCERCRVFFFRCVKTKLPKPCKLRNNCIITTNRKRCASCRFRRCLVIEMDENRVGQQSPRKKPQTSHLLDAVDPFPSEFVADMTKYYLSYLFTQNPTVQSTALETILYSHRLSLNEDGPSPQFATANVSMSLLDVLHNPSLCSTRDTACFGELRNSKQKKIGPISSFLSPYCRRIISFADLLQSTHYFMELSLLDMEKIAQYNFGDFRTLCLLEYELKNGVDLERFSSCSKDYAAESKFFALSVQSDYAFNHLMQKVQLIFNELQLDDIEFMALKVIAMFTTPSGISEDGMRKVKIIKDIFTSKLCNHIFNKYPDMNDGAVLKRVQKLHEIIRNVKKYCGVVALFYTEIVTCNYAGISGQISYDLHVRQM